MISLTLENFKALSKKGNLIPIFKEISLDYDNPLSILKKISSKKYCFLLETSDGPEKWSQYSFLGFDPNLIISSEKMVRFLIGPKKKNWCQSKIEHDKTAKTNKVKDNKFKKTTSPIKSNFTKSNFMSAVKKIKSYVKKGDVIQTVVSQRWETKYEDDPINLYRSLRKLNPSPYMFYLKMEKSLIVGASPEVLVRLENDKVESRPIAGTRPRGIDTEEDLKMEKDLLSDPKELAEHVMLVDLARNDISRVCKNSTVNVTEMMSIERYSHVMHIVSHVEGLIDKKKDAFDLLKSTFPAGTLSGAPKIRAMQIINELEPNQRGPYGGSVGYFGFSGNMDMSIVIRSFYIKNKTLYFQAGAGIVADSIPKNEYDETKNKSKAMLNAIRKSLNNE